MKRTQIGLWTLTLSAAACLTGCRNGNTAPKPQPLTPEAFISPRSGTISGAGGTAVGSGGTVGAGESATPAIAIPANGVSNTNDKSISKPAAPIPIPAPIPRPGDDPKQPTPDPAPRSAVPASLPTIGASSGQFMTLGGVVAEVNGTPIYANKVLASLDPILRQKARQLDAARFRRDAYQDIKKTIDELIRVELFYAAAQRTLEQDDKRLAEGLTIQWRVQQITRAGGSVELAKRRARDEFGADFDDLVLEQSRTELTRIYEQKKIVPRIQVTASDIRDYYDKNVDREYSEAERVKFRLIKVDFMKTGTKEHAMDKATHLLNRAKSGEDFTDMATKENDEKMFAGKEAMEMSPGSFSIAKVRDVLPKLQPGQVSDLIEDKAAYYIVKLDERKPGRVRPFEEQKVQDEIRSKLRIEQYRKLRELDFARLMKGAAIRTDDEMASIALDMAMQKYAQYAAAK
ncbi:MAG: peptidylprolyl cis-trans isomerase, PpiC-type, SurA family [Phycisphaerales bacterium]|nr:peptidylprolyl cis-trans isomerase, PpiC-type, SurA family [Phycisphaerales bacterium]